MDTAPPMDTTDRTPTRTGPGPHPGETLEVDGQTLEILTVDRYPDGLRLTLATPEA